MSVKGYIVREKSIWVDEKNMICQWNNDGYNLVKYVHKSEEFCIDVWSQSDLMKEMFKFGASDYTNDENVGVVEISYECFKNMVENSKLEFSDDDWDTINILNKYFNEEIMNTIVTLNCY